ncbi:MAG TPA: hypothetical protein VFX38_06320, partial [Gammaproteobacteria bacterium]|nr:hypothetical protein [Gammaproteobacteria bacterium]
MRRPRAGSGQRSERPLYADRGFAARDFVTDCCHPRHRKRGLQKSARPTHPVNISPVGWVSTERFRRHPEIPNWSRNMFKQALIVPFAVLALAAGTALAHPSAGS